MLIAFSTSYRSMTFSEFPNRAIRTGNVSLSLLYHIQTAENKGVTESHNFLIEKYKPSGLSRPHRPFFQEFLLLFAERNNKSIENCKYFSEPLRYNKINIHTPEGGHLKW